MKHVLIIPSWYPSRHRPIPGIFFKEQAEILSKKIDKVGVISPLFRSFKDFDFTKNEENYYEINGVNTYTEEIWHYPKLRKLNKKNWVKTCKQLFHKYIAENGLPDIIHIHSVMYAGKFAEYAKKKYNVPFVITEHATGFALDYFSNKELKEFSKEIKSSSYNIAVSQSIADTLTEKINGKWKVIPNTIKNVFFEEGIKNLHNTKNKNKKIFFSLSGLIPIKGLNVLIDAFTILEKQFPDTELWIGGDGTEKTKLQNQILQNRLQDKVFLLGKLSQSEVIENLRKVHFYVSPSLQETFGIVIIEALALGLPTVATICGGPEHIINDKVGVVVEKNSAAELYQAMKYLLQNEEQYNSEEIINYCRENYSEDVVSDAIIEVYKQVQHG